MLGEESLPDRLGGSAGSSQHLQPDHHEADDLLRRAAAASVGCSVARWLPIVDSQIKNSSSQPDSIGLLAEPTASGRSAIRGSIFGSPARRKQINAGRAEQSRVCNAIRRTRVSAANKQSDLTDEPRKRAQFSIQIRQSGRRDPI